MTFNLDMTLVGVIALILGVAAFFAPRFLGLVFACGLVLFGAFQLFPQVMDSELGRTISNIDLNDIQIEETAPPNSQGDTRS